MMVKLPLNKDCLGSMVLSSPLKNIFKKEGLNDIVFIMPKSDLGKLRELGPVAKGVCVLTRSIKNRDFPYCPVYGPLYRNRFFPYKRGHLFDDNPVLSNAVGSLQSPYPSGPPLNIIADGNPVKPFFEHIEQGHAVFSPEDGHCCPDPAVRQILIIIPLSVLPRSP